ncbi:MAG: ABC transporter permease [Alphaproteobacteria bacterium]|nr:ABC transporter permease [Alphaproteobacteria bacterium]
MADLPTAPPRVMRRGVSLAALLKLPMLPVLLVAFLALSVSIDGFVSAANLANMARLFAPLAIAAIGLTFVFLLGEIDLSIGSVLSLASVLGALTMRGTASVWLGVMVMVATGALIGALNGAVIAWFRFSAFVYTLGVLVTARAIAMLITGGHSVGRLPFGALRFGRGTFAGLPWLLWIAIAVYAAAHLFLRQTVIGREIALVGANRRAAVFAGLRVRRARFTGFLVSGTLAGLAASCIVLRLGSGGPILGDNILLMAIAAVVLGGTSVFGGEGGAFRTVTGALVVVTLDKGLNLLGLAFYDQAIVMGLVIVLGSALGGYLYRRRTGRA